MKAHQVARRAAVLCDVVIAVVIDGGRHLGAVCVAEADYSQLHFSTALEDVRHLLASCNICTGWSVRSAATFC